MRSSSLAAVLILLLFIPAFSAFSSDDPAVKGSATAELCPPTEGPSKWVFRHARMITGLTLKGTDLPTAAGMRVAIDPETGELRQPTVEELQALDRQQSTEGLRRLTVQATDSGEVQLPDGTVMAALDEGLMNYSVGLVTAAGISFTCVDGGSHAHGQLPAAAPAREEK